ncbi:uncharacterized protein YkwD [Cytobacillus eiseniae]|uniref:Uncharacterized protein YkwD n=1 Tax=Cytobacillus eiseniae TaxID=762947 RepID=A0ABS4R9V8_9BACI|nr:CAP domain-containing protein [Cytobacillus eiseniae]MBP2239678.1 uncharacterized protein YkwD [Cytobacillus eiseniae]
MRKIIRSLLFLFILFISWPFIEKQIAKTEFYPIYESIQSEIRNIIEDPNVTAALLSIYDTVNDITSNNNEDMNNSSKEIKQVEKPDLAIPSGHAFSVHNIVLGKLKTEVEGQLGQPQRTSYNEYGNEWHTYHNNYQNFIMVAYDEKNQVNALYTNQDLISSSYGIKLGSQKDEVIQQLGKPLEHIRKGLTYFELPKETDYDVFLIDHSFITIFYDKHEGNVVTSIQIIREDLEKRKKSFYTDETTQLKEGFEYQLFDLTNASRITHGLSTLGWDDHVKETARKHSNDMAELNYFSHTNLDGDSPFDRMNEDDIFFTVAGENLATGQFSSIYAHEGLMNSLGHRENILKPEYQFLGVGVAFNEEAHPYYTENFFK